MARSRANYDMLVSLAETASTSPVGSAASGLTAERAAWGRNRRRAEPGAGAVTPCGGVG